MNLTKLRKMVADGDMSEQALRYLLDCRGECEYLDFKQELHFTSDYSAATIGKDLIAMKNSGGGYIVIGVEDKTWKPLGLSEPINIDTKKLRDLARKATGLEIQADIVTHRLHLFGKELDFGLILVRATQKLSKLRTPSLCKQSFQPNETWGIRNGDIYFRKSDQTVRVSSQEELDELIEDFRERQDRANLEQQLSEPSPFAIETGLYRLLPKEYETFIGRRELQQSAKEALERDPRVWIVNLYGPGGVGKSSLASWLAYHYYEEGRFEAILQLSAKDTMLTPNGITRLQRRTLYSLEDLLDSIFSLFNFNEYSLKPLDERKQQAIELLSAWSLLLILDNMETVSDGRIMEFVRSLPPGSKAKVLLTSRARTGSWEMPTPIGELTLMEVKEFLRIKSAQMSIDLPGNFDHNALQIHQASGGLPLAIQWILGQFLITNDLSSVVNRVRDPDSPLLEFSFRNSWSILNSDEQRALAVLSIFDEPPTIHWWATALGWTAERVERATSRLIDATFVSKVIDSKTNQETFHSLPITLAFARNELGRMGDLEIVASTRYQRHIQEMELVAFETERFNSLFDKFNVQRDTEKQAVILARRAESQADGQNNEEAERLYQKAKQTDPRSVYVLINYGLFKLQIGQVKQATELMEEAATFCDRRLGFFVYSNLAKAYETIRSRDKVEVALRKALDYNPDHNVTRHQLGVVVSKLGRYQQAIDIFDEIIRAELNNPVGPSDTLVYAYKTKIISLKKSGDVEAAKNVLEAATNTLKTWPYLARKAELEDFVI